MDDCENTCADQMALRAAYNVLKEDFRVALDKYGQHLSFCEVVLFNRKCDCGLDDLLYPETSTAAETREGKP